MENIENTDKPVTATGEKQIFKILRKCIEAKASDLHLSADEYPMYRIDGEIKRIPDEPLYTSEHIYNVITELMTKKYIEHFNEVFDHDFSLEVPGAARFRVNFMKNNRGFGAVLRTIPSKIQTLYDLNCPPVFAELCMKPRGLILVTGPTGSGKSTTLAAMINHINETRQEHILTIEDPIEFVHHNKNCLVTQREVFRDTESFEVALRAALREDPDIILVGEMRDLETIKLALTAAETGHLVFGTLHTTSAAKTIDRIVDVFPREEKDMVRTMLSESLQAVISQALIKRKSGGRIAAHEVMIATPAIRNLIRENKVGSMNSTIETGKAHGMLTLDQSLKNLVSHGDVALEDAKAIANSPDTLK